MHGLEKIKLDLGVMAQQFAESVQIGFNLAMDYFKEQAKKMDLDDYYFKTLYIPITPIYNSPTQTNVGNEEAKVEDQP